MKYDVITIGGATEDLSFYTDEGIFIENKKDILRQKLLAFEYGAKLKVNKYTTTFGGGAANAAVSLRRLGFRSAALVAVGDDERGKAIIANFRKEKVNTGLIQVIKGEMSGLSPAIVGKDNEHIFFSIRAANSKLNLGARDLKEFAKTRWLYLTSLSGKWQAELKKIFSVKAAAGKGVRIFWNPGHIQLNYGKPVLGRYLSQTDVLMINLDEARELVMSDPPYRRKDPSFFDSVKELAEIIQGWGPKIVIITQGKVGASAYDGKHLYFEPAAREKRKINTIGVGDAFGSSFVAGLELFKGDIRKAMHLGVKNTASVVAHEGAQAGLLRGGQLEK